MRAVLALHFFALLLALLFFWLFFHILRAACFTSFFSTVYIYCSRVIETLRTVPAERRAFRMIGEVLVEKTAGTVLPELESTREQVSLWFHYSLVVAL